MTRTPLLSIIIVGRNDDYLGGYRYRLQTCLDFLAMNLRRLGRLDDVEVVYVDWNSEGPPLSKDIRVTRDAAKLLRFIIVPPEIARNRNELVDFFTTCAVNVGVRRAKGEFIMLADSDCIMPLPSLKALLEVLDGTLPALGGPRERLIYPVPRHQIPGQVSLRQPNVPAWEYILKKIFPSRRKELPGADCLGGFSAAQLMHRDLWYEFGGYNEKLDRAWGWSDNDLMLRVTHRYPWMDVGYYGVVAFHIQHHVFRADGKHSRDPDSINLMMNTYKSNPNDEDWGLARTYLPEETVQGYGDIPDYPEWLPSETAIRQESDMHAILASPECAKISGEAAYNYAFRSSDPEVAKIDDAIATLAAIAMIAGRCRNVLVAGAFRPAGLLSVIVANPAIDIILARCWSEGDLAQEAAGPGELSMLLANAPFFGYARIINGPVAECFRNLAMTEKYLLPFELALVDKRSLGDEFERVLGLILDQLPEGGMVIVTDPEGGAPPDAERREIYLGRMIAKSREPYHARRSTFYQHTDEAKLGTGFAALRLAEGEVQLIAKVAPPTEKPAEEVPVLLHSEA